MSAHKPGSSLRAKAPPPPTIIDRRFRVQGTLGAGGMATVYEVLDASNGRRLALKRLHPHEDALKRRRTIELFEREFYTLSHLVHPRVVEAFDYGVDEFGPYYTMELLDGGELQGLVPLPWRRACAVARDICSALSLLHSRRLVYRDLNPRNVRCASDGTAKLIDFGAMSNMGPSKQVVGTPAYCAPEALDFQALDARTDLYSLGATLYFMLTGRHAYPARSFEQLRNFWQSQPVSTIDVVAEVPPALDALVMDLLHLDPSVRPANAAEVMEQLAVIEGRTFEELPQVSQAYLSAPNLVGRDAAQTRMRAKVVRAIRGRGGSLLIEGPSGVGRTRLMAACLLDAKLHGALALRADAGDAEGDYGVMRALCRQLLESAFELTTSAAAPHMEWLQHALPDLSPQPRAANDAELDPNRVRSNVMTALKDWILAIAAQRPLLFAIDDMHLIDEPSVAALALLTHDIGKDRLVVVATAEVDAVATAPSALKVFADAATTLRLTNLDGAHTEALLRSVFGDVPHVQMVAHKLHAITEGNPRDLMLLAQYLVDRQLATYRAGSWALPASIDTANLPSSMAQALRVRVTALSEVARELGLFMTLSADRGLSFDECVSLCSGRNAAAVAEALDELQRAQIVLRLADVHTIAQRGFVAALQEDVDEPKRHRIHEALADLFQRRGDEEFRRAQHLFRANQNERALDVLLEYAARSQALTDEVAEEYFKLTRALPEDWFECFQQGLRACADSARPRKDWYTLQARLAGLVDVMNVPGSLGYPPLHDLLGLLFTESGLADYEALDPKLDSMERLKIGVETAQARFLQHSEHERVFEPLTAIRYLVRAAIATTGLAAKNIDYQLWRSIPSLEPLVPVAPAIGLAYGLAVGVGARTTAQMEKARATYKRLVEQTTDPNSSGLGESNHRYLRYGVMFGLGTIEACMGLPSSLEWATAIETEPTHQVNALLVRLLYHLWQGEVREADKYKEKIELLRIRNSPRQWLEGAHLPGQAIANAASDDLTRIKQTVNDLEPLAQRQAPWMPVRDFALAEYDRIRGDLRSASQRFERLMATIEAGRHQIWPNAAGGHTRVLFENGQHEQARTLGAAYLEQAERAELGYMANYIKMPLALALGKSGEVAEAIRIAEDVIASFTELGTRGLNLVLAFETRARVAIMAKSDNDYARYAMLCSQHSRNARSRVLMSKHERLKQAATAAEVRIAQTAIATEIATTRIGLTSVISSSDKPIERSRKALELVLQSSGTRSGFLYWLGEQGPELSAQLGGIELPPSMTSYVHDFIESELHEREEHTQSLEEAEVPELLWTSDQGERYRPVLLSHHTPEGFVVTGLVIVVENADMRFIHPGAVVAQLSRLAAESGDASPTLVD